MTTNTEQLRTALIERLRAPGFLIGSQPEKHADVVLEVIAAYRSEVEAAKAEVGGVTELPPLPEPAQKESEGVCCGNPTVGASYMGQHEELCCGNFDEAWPDYYTADQMRDYARAALQATQQAGAVRIETLVGMAECWEKNAAESREQGWGPEAGAYDMCAADVRRAIKQAGTVSDADSK